MRQYDPLSTPIQKTPQPADRQAKHSFSIFLSGTDNAHDQLWVGTAGDGYSGMYLFSGGTYTIKNNIISGNYTYSIDDDDNSCTETASNNLTYGYTTAATHDVTNGNPVTSDPLFTIAGSVFTLQTGSPAINAGVSVGLSIDILGHPIIGLPDIGAYEKQ